MLEIVLTFAAVAVGIVLAMRIDVEPRARPARHRAERGPAAPPSGDGPPATTAGAHRPD